MLDALSRPKQVSKEMNEDWDGAMYWFYKKQGGEKEVKKKTIKLASQATYQKKNIYCEPIKWTSKNGNKWLIFFVFKYYESQKIAYPHLIGFVYYETNPSIGVYATIEGSNDDGKQYIIHYTSHFFLRLAERAGIKANSTENIKGFIDLMVAANILVNPDGRKGTSKHGYDADAIIKLPGSYGFGGFVTDDNTVMLVIKSFLTSQQLTKKQKKFTDHLSKLSNIHGEAVPDDLLKFEALKHVKKDTEEEVIKLVEEQKRRLIELGESKEVISRVESLAQFVNYVMISLGYIKSDDNLALIDFNSINGNTYFRICESPYYIEISLKDMLFILRKTAINAGYGHVFNSKNVAKFLMNSIHEITNEVFEKKWEELNFTDEYTPKHLL